MNSTEFIHEKLRELAFLFPQVNIKYGFDKIIETHIVELLPEKEYYQNALLDDAWINLSIEFKQNYFDQEIVFVSSDSSLRIEDVIFEFNNQDFFDNYLMASLFSSLTNNLISYTFPTIIPDGLILENSQWNLLGQRLEETIITQEIHGKYSEAA